VLHDRLEVGEGVVILRKRSRSKGDAQKSKNSGSLGRHFIEFIRKYSTRKLTVQAELEPLWWELLWAGKTAWDD
jgi:hypothetical protein